MKKVLKVGLIVTGVLAVVGAIVAIIINKESDDNLFDEDDTFDDCYFNSNYQDQNCNECHYKDNCNIKNLDDEL